MSGFLRRNGYSPLLLSAGCLLPMAAVMPASAAPCSAEHREGCEYDEVQIDKINVEASAEPLRAGKTSYDRDHLESTPTGDGNLADVLRTNPAVDFSSQADMSGASASTRPGEISIHGQPFYENLFMIDGADVTSGLDPASDSDVTTPSLVGPVGGSSSQGYYVDTDLLESIEVYDSNIPARYSGFTGGVVDARLKRYSGQNKARLRYGLKRDEWESFHVNPDSLVAADSYQARYAPEYRKEQYALSLEQGLSENTGLTLGLSRRTSSFDQVYEDGADHQVNLTYNESVDNLLGRVDTRLGSLDAGISFRYANRNYERVTSPNYDGLYSYDHQGLGATLELGGELGAGRMEMKVALDHLSDSMDGKSDGFVYHESAEGSDTSRYSGGFGDMKQAQTSLSIEPQWQSDGLAWGSSEHRLSVGAAVKYIDSYYERPGSFSYLNYSCVEDNGSQGCIDQDGDGVSDWDDEYLASSVTYQAGRVDAQYVDTGFYLEDRIGFGNWSVVPGLRLDWNDYLRNIDLAPRLGVEWQPFGNADSRFFGGLNRYYGRDFLRYRVKDSVYGWRQSETYNSAGESLRVTTYNNRSGASELETPYSDEAVLGWIQTLGPLQAKLQWVNRERHRGIRQQKDDDGNLYYDNGAETRVNNYTLELTALEPWRLNGSTTHYGMTLGYKERSGDDANLSYDDELDADRVYYQGRLIAESDLPDWDYNVPWNLSFYTATELPAWHLNWSNLVRLKQGGTAVRNSGDDYTDPESGSRYDIYEAVAFDRLVTLDTKLQWQPPLLANSEGYVQLEVRNVFDEVVAVDSSSSSRSSSGRQFWFEVGVNF